MAETKQTTTTATAITLDLSSLATSSTLLDGVESGEINNSTNNYMDCIVNMDEVAGHASTAPTIGQVIEIWVWGSDTSLATTPIDVLDGTSSAETLSHAAVKQGLAFAGAASVTVATAALSYRINPFSVAQLFGGVMPDFWGLFVTHNHTGALAAAMSGKFSYQGVTYTSV